MAFVEFHLIQNYAPSNLNRDDTNAPKSCHFGGSRRSRISSQCQKRQVRLHPEFKQAVQNHVGDLGARTKKLPLEIAEDLQQRGHEKETSEKVAEKLLLQIKLKLAKDKELRTQYLLYLGHEEIANLKTLAADFFEELQQKDVPKEVTQKIKEAVSKKSYAADIALFGRMVADNKDMNVDAACQVAHAISTNELKTDMDFFTAVDDLLTEEEQGSGMMGTLFFNSACFYRYAQINLGLLAENLQYDKQQLLGAVAGFYRGLLLAQPSGKQNSFAAHNLPSYIKVTVRDSGTPWSLTNAFIAPVTASDSQPLDLASTEKLQQHDQQLKTMYGDKGFVFEGCVHNLEGLKKAYTTFDSIDALEHALTEQLQQVIE